MVNRRDSLSVLLLVNNIGIKVSTELLEYSPIVVLGVECLLL